MVCDNPECNQYKEFLQETIEDKNRIIQALTTELNTRNQELIDARQRIKELML